MTDIIQSYYNYLHYILVFTVYVIINLDVQIKTYWLNVLLETDAITLFAEC